MIQKTSLWAYQRLEKIGRKQKDCYRTIEQLGEASNYDIAQELDWEINRVTPRVKELRELKLVEEAYKALHPITDRTVIYWKVADNG